MGENLKKLSGNEMKVMKIIWENPGISSDMIYEAVSKEGITSRTVLHNISEKGYVKSEQIGRHHFYYACVSQLEYERAMINQKLKKTLGHDSFECLLANFCGKKKLSTEQKEKVMKFLEELENDTSE